MPPAEGGSGYRDLFVTASDGLRLYAREYGPRVSRLCPVVCLPGLSRNSEDFHPLAQRLARDAPPRRVLALDYRGRGRSEHDRDWRNYNFKVELDDVLQVLTVAGIDAAIFIGTSRGGLLTMALSAARPSAIRAAILNDIGPVIEAKGLARIRDYVGKLPMPHDEAGAGAILKDLLGPQFPHVTDEDWRRYARGTWMAREGGLALAYDPALMKTLEALDLEAPIPPVWPLFQGLSAVPLLVLRGERSDLLSAETLDAMARAHPAVEAVTIAGQGHAPLLYDERTIAQIAAFIARVG